MASQRVAERGVSQCRPRLVRNCARERGPITANACCRQNLRLQLRVHGHSWLWVPDRARCARLSGTTELEYGATILDSIFKQSTTVQLQGRHSGAMPTGPRKARPDDRLRIEPGISRFPDAQLRI